MSTKHRPTIVRSLIGDKKHHAYLERHGKFLVFIRDQKHLANGKMQAVVMEHECESVGNARAAFQLTKFFISYFPVRDALRVSAEYAAQSFREGRIEFALKAAQQADNLVEQFKLHPIKAMKAAEMYAEAAYRFASRRKHRRSV